MWTFIPVPSESSFGIIYLLYNDDSFDTIILDAIRKATQRSTEISKELTNE